MGSGETKVGKSCFEIDENSGEGTSQSFFSIFAYRSYFGLVPRDNPQGSSAKSKFEQEKALTKLWKGWLP